MLRWLQKLNRKRILYTLRITGMFALSLVLAMFTTSFAPQMFREPAAEAVDSAPKTELSQTQTEPLTTLPAQTTAPSTEPATETSPTSNYKANTNVVVQVATGDREKDEDTGGE